ncbi:MAG: P1 family peptidase [Chloroflexi bacterium]|nr:P1 family peptidase [Chloroflexota bacterium]
MQNQASSAVGGSGRARARELGLALGPLNAITDVPGVRVGHTTLSWGEGPLVLGKGPVRTGVTVIVPHEGRLSTDPVYAGYHVLNGNGEMTGLIWLAESGLLSTPIGLTNTHSVGVARDALIAYDVTHGGPPFLYWWSCPVVAETWDGLLSDINGQHVRPEHVFAALDAADGGPVAEGCVGSGTGMICHGFKGGIGTASRLVSEADGGWIVGALVQANHGQRYLLRVDGVPLGRLIPAEAVPLPGPAQGDGAGSIIVVIATNAPLLPGQCRRLAQRATLGIARTGGLGENSSGDIFLAFATGNRGLHREPGSRAKVAAQAVADEALTPLFEAAGEATEEAIVNALCAAVTTSGGDGRITHALPLDRLQEIMGAYRPWAS